MQIALTKPAPKTIKIRTSPAPRVFGDELFPELVPSLGGLITCRVCERIEMVPITHPAILCLACLSDLSATAAHVADVYAAALAYFMEASEALRTAALDSPERAWWGRVDAARMAADKDQVLFDRAWANARTAGGEKARLCELAEKADREAVRLEPLNAWYTAASRELRAARAAAGEPVAI